MSGSSRSLLPWRRRAESRRLSRESLPSAFTAELEVGDHAGLSPRGALRLAEVYSCVRVLGGAASTLPLKVYGAGDDRRERVESTTAQLPGLLARPWPGATTSDLIGQTMTSLLLSGDAFIGIYRDRDSAPVQLGLLAPDAVEVRLDGTEIVYKLATKDGPVDLGTDDVIHVRSPLTLPGALRGMSPVRWLATTMGEAANLGESAASFANNASRPGLVWKVDSEFAGNPEVREALRAEAKARWSRSNAGGPAIVGGVDEIVPLQLDLVSRQFLEQRTFAAGTIARVFGVPAHLLDLPAGDSMTYANTEGRSADFLRYSLETWLVAIERAVSGSSIARGVTAEFERRALLRATAPERASVYTDALAGGWMTVDEVRSAESLPPLPDRTKVPGA